MNEESKLISGVVIRLASNRNDCLIKASLLAGKIMLENGAETSRVEDTMERMISKALGVERSRETFTYITLNGIFVKTDMNNTNFVRIDNRDHNLDKITKVNQLSRLFTEGLLTIEEVYEKLQEVDKEKMGYSLTMKFFFTAILSGSVMLIMNGTFIDLPASMIGGLICYLSYLLAYRYLKIPFITEYIAAFFGGLAAFFVNGMVGSHLSSVMIGTVAPLVPGIAITNAIRDILAKHYISGSIRLVEGIFIAGSIGTGIATVYYIFIQ